MTRRARQDRAAVRRVVEFFERYLRHVKGEWAGRPFRLQRWQVRDFLAPVFGRRNPDGTRQVRTGYLEVPRKNGKSELIAGCGLYLLFADDEEGAEVYSAAADTDQARIVFEMARRMVRMSPALARRCRIYAKSIVVPATGSSYKVLSRVADTKHGINASGILFDEVHTQRTRDLWDTLTTSTGARRQPLTLGITTAGSDPHSLCAELHRYAEQVRDGVIADPSWHPVIYAAPPEADWTKERTWRRANPSYGITVKPDYLRTEARRAQQVPAYENAFRRLHLNQWTAQDVRWMPMKAWDACAGEVAAAGLAGRRGFAGLDLASTTDLAALLLVFPADDGTFDVLPHFWCPAENLAERSRRDRVPYEVWARHGYLTATPGSVIDYEHILARVVEERARFDLVELAYDRWGATRLAQDLTEAGVQVVEFGQGYASMSAPTKELLSLVLAGRVRHGGHPVLRWCADNVVVETDAAGNLKPSKRRSREKIDGIVALIMALDRAVRHGGSRGGSIYDERGLETV